MLEDPERSRALRLLERQPGRVVPGAERGCGAPSSARTCSPSSLDLFATDTCRPRRRRAAGGQLAGVRRPRRPVLPPRAVGAGEGVRAARAGAAQQRDLPPRWRPRWASRTRPCSSPTTQIIDQVLQRTGTGLRLRRAGAARHRVDAGRRARRPVRRAAASRRRAGGSSSPRTRPRPMGTAGCRGRRPTSAPRAGRLRLLSPASPWSLNASFSNDAKVSRQLGRADAVSVTASRRGGVRSSKTVPWRGCRAPPASLVVPVAITDALPAGVGADPKGRLAEAPGRGRQRQCAHARAVAATWAPAPPIHGLEVEVTPVGSRVP